MFVNLLILAGSLALILLGANYLTDGASAVAKRMGISDLIIGLTIVAFGTSAPELVISIVSATEGNASLAIGNIVGSNILNILLILGITALIRPIVIKKSVMTNEIPMVILASVILVVFGYSGAFDHTGINEISRVDGIMLLVFFLLFMRYTFASARQVDPTSPDPASADGEKLKRINPWLSAVYIVGGLAALVFGGDKFVDSASALARHWGVSDAVIGLTIVAIGSSLPELATSIVAAVKGEAGLAIGNVIGSNIFNIVFVLGTAAVITPLPFAGVSQVDLLVMLGASIIFLVFGWFFKTRTLTRPEGAAMLLLYVAYMLYLLHCQAITSC